MKKIIWMSGFAALVFAGFNSAGAQGGPAFSVQASASYDQNQPVPQRVGRPLFLRPNQMLQDTSDLQDADVPVDNDGNSLNYDLDNAPPSSQFMASLNSPGFTRQITRFNRKEADAGQYYWHTYMHRRFSHFTDDMGNHWYGGPSDEANHKWVMLLWRNGRFWWHDMANNRWLYFYRNHWWSVDAQNPAFVDVYLNGAYYPCDRMGQVQMPPTGQGRLDGDHREDGDHPDGWKHRRGDDGDDHDGQWKHRDDQGDDHRDDHDRQWNRGNGQTDQGMVPNNPPPGNGQAPGDLGTTQYTDPAKTRLLKVTGPNRDAFLYDITPSHTLDNVYLMSNVRDVVFSNDASGKVWMITLTLQDGHTKGYNADGHLTMP